MKNNIILAILIAVVFMITSSFAETIKLKNGKSYECPIIEKQSDYLCGGI